MDALQATSPVLPDTLESFIALRDDLQSTPEGAAAAWIVASMVYDQEAKLGQCFLAAMADASRLAPGPLGYEERQLGRRDLAPIGQQVSRNPGLGASCVAGATPGNGYALPDLP